MWFSLSAQWPTHDVSAARAVLGTGKISSMQPLRVMYQVHDAHGNTRTSARGETRVYYDASRFIPCGDPDVHSGIGECSGRLEASYFLAPTSLSLSLSTNNDVAVANFASVSVSADPDWHREGGWDGFALPEPIFGVVLPFENVHIREDESSAAFDVQVMLRSKTSGLTAAQRTISTGQFELRWSGPHDCAVQSYRSTNNAWSTLAPASVQQPGSYLMSIYGLQDSLWAQAQGNSISVMALNVRCDGTGDYSFSIETKELGDANPADCTPTVTLDATAVGRADGYSVSATVRLVETRTIHTFAYASDGRAYVNNFQTLGQPATSISVRLDSISDNPNRGRSQDVSCIGSCSYTPHADFEGTALLNVQHGALSDSVSVEVRRPRNVSLSADAVRLSVLGTACGNETKYASSQLRLMSEGLDLTQLATFISSSPTVVEVVGSRVVGRSPGQAIIRAGSSSEASVLITVDGDATVQPSLVARVVTRLESSSREQSFVSELSQGYLYVHALYADGHAAPVDTSNLAVDVHSTNKLTYGVTANGRARVGVATNALRSGCYEPLLSVSLVTCSASIGAVQPPLSLRELPEPVGVAFELSEVDVAAEGSFARSGALSDRPSEYGKVSVARVTMSDGGAPSLLQDARVAHLTCVAVIANLSSARLDGETSSGR